MRLRGRGGDAAWLRRLTGGIAAVPLAALAFILVVLAVEAVPAISVNGWGFITHTAFDLGSTYGAIVTGHGTAHPAGAHYGVAGWLVGTVESSVIALVIAVPVSVLAGLVVVEKLPRRASRLIGLFLETLAGIPSVVIGLWGALTIGPLLARDVYPHIAGVMPAVPVLGFFGGNVGNGEGLLTSGIVLSVMVIPIVASTARDLFASVPSLPKEGAEALGMSDWEVARRVTVPWVRSGIIGASVLGLARALGETMAVAMVSGVVLSGTPSSIYAPITTIAATIVTQLDSAFTDTTGFAVRSLAEAALALTVITLVVTVLARLLVRRASSTPLPVGRGI